MEVWDIYFSLVPFCLGLGRVWLEFWGIRLGWLLMYVLPVPSHRLELMVNIATGRILHHTPQRRNPPLLPRPPRTRSAEMGRNPTTPRAGNQISSRNCSRVSLRPLDVCVVYAGSCAAVGGSGGDGGFCEEGWRGNAECGYGDVA